MAKQMPKEMQGDAVFVVGWAEAAIEHLNWLRTEGGCQFVAYDIEATIQTYNVTLRLARAILDKAGQEGDDEAK